MEGEIGAVVQGSVAIPYLSPLLWRECGTRAAFVEPVGELLPLLGQVTDIAIPWKPPGGENRVGLHHVYVHLVLLRGGALFAAVHLSVHALVTFVGSVGDPEVLAQIRYRRKKSKSTPPSELFSKDLSVVKC